MRFTLLTGDDDVTIAGRRSELLRDAGGAAEHIDVALDGGAALLSAIACPSLLGGCRVVAAENFDKFDKGNVASFVAAAEHSDAVVVARGATPRPTLRKAVAPLGSIEKHVLAKGRDVPRAVAAMCAQHGLSLRPDALEVLVARAGEQPGRVRSICWQLATLGLTRPDARQVAVLCGSADRAGAPWDVTDALTRGAVADALAAAAPLEPLAVLGYVAKQLEQAGRCVDVGCQNADGAAELLGVTPFVGRKSFELGRRLGADGIAESWDVVAGATLAAKRGRAAEALDVALCRLAPLWSNAAVRAR